MKSSSFFAACLAFFSLALLESHATPAPGLVVSATKTADVSASVRTKHQGDTISYTTTLTNSNASAVTGLTLTDPTPDNTTLVPGSVHVSPVAIDDTYSAIGNTKLYVGTTAPNGEPAVVVSSNVIANDTVLTDSVTVTIGSTPSHGSVVLGTDGTFTYTPTVGYTGTDTFTYLSTNTADNTLTDTGTVTINVSTPVWYVDNSKTSGTGASTSPLNSLTALAAVNLNAGPAISDLIYLYKGNANYTGNLTLKASQQLVGQGVNLVVNSTTLVAAGTGNTPTLGGTLTLANSNSVSGLNISSGTATGLLGANVTGASVTLGSVTTTTASAISLTTVTGTFTFTSVSSSGGTATGIYVNGLTGSFTVSGNGSAGTGGTIANKSGSDSTTTTGIGIYLNNVTSGVSLSWMQLNGFGNYGILGTTVSNLNLTNVVVNGVNGDNASLLEDAVSLTNFTGSGTFTNCTFTGGYVDNLRLANSTGTLNRLVITGCTFGLNSTASGNDSLGISATGTASVNVQVTGSSFAGARGDMIDATGQTGTTLQVDCDHNTLANTHTSILSGGGGVILQSAGTGTFTFTDSTITGARGRALNIGKSGFTSILPAGTVTVTANHNTIGNSAATLSGSLEASGIYVDGSGTGKMTATITNNTIFQTNEAGIYLVANNQATAANNATLDATVTGNSVANSGPLAFASIFADIGAGVSSDATSAFLDISSNISSDPANAGFFSISLSDATTTVVRLPSYAGAAGDTTAVATYLTARNSGSPTAFAQVVAATPASAGYANGVAFLTLQPAALPVASAPAAVVTADEAPAARPAPVAALIAPITTDDLQLTVATALTRWTATGLTADQVSLLRGLDFELADLTDHHLGSADGQRVMIDRHAGGPGWSVADTVPATQLDLLTAVLHEMGHSLGLEDTYAAADRASVMYGFLTPGERRLPVAGQALGVQPGAHSHLHFLSAPLVIGTLPAGKSVTVKCSVTIANPLPGGVSQISAQGTWTGTNISSTATDDPGVAGSTDATITLVGIPPAITTNPVAQSAPSGTTATFTAAASGAEAPGVLWQVSNNGGGSYTNIPGTTSPSLSVTAVPASDGYLYRAVFTNTTNSATTTGATLTVTPAILVSLAVTPVNPSIAKGTSQQFIATGTFTDATTQNLTSSVTWSSSAPGTAPISNQGLVTAISTGSSTITAVSGAINSFTTLTVTPPTLVSIAVTPVNPSVIKGATQQFTATGSYTDNTTKDITNTVIWASATPATATIASQGLATSVNAGTSLISATSDSVTGSTTLTVTLLPSPTTLGVQASANSANTLSYTVPAGNNRLLVVTASHPSNGGAALTSVTFGPQAMTQAVLSTDGSTAIDSIWILPMGSSASPTTATITVTLNAGANSLPCSFVSAQAFQNTSQTSSIQTVAGSNVSGGVSNSSLSITSSATDTVFDIFDTYRSDNTLTATAGNGQTQVSTSNVINLAVYYTGYGLWKTSTKPGTGATTAMSWTSNAGAYLSAAISLKAAPAATAPTISTPTKASIAGTTVTLGANVTSDGGATITKRGVVYAQTSLNSNPTVGGSNVTEVDDVAVTTGVFTAAVTGLTGSTGYSYVGFVTSSLGTSYTSVDTFTTGKTLSSIVVTPANPSIAAGTTQQFTATASYSDSSTQDLTSFVVWSSATSSVAGIDPISGLATGLSSGTSIITAAGIGINSAISGSATLTVIAPTLVAITVSPSTPRIAKGTSQQFTATGTYSDNTSQNLTSTVTWSSSATSVASISNLGGSQGLASGVNSGSSTITATSGAVNGTATLTVAAPPTLTLGLSAASLRVNTSATLTFTVSNPNSFALTGVSVSDILPAGLVVGTPNGLTGSFSGSVTAVAGSSSISLSGATIASGANLTFSVIVTATTGGVKNNSATPSATESGAGIAAQASLAVIAPPTIALAYSKTTMSYGATTTITFTLTNPNASTLTGVTFSDSLPSGYALATPSNFTNGAGGNFTPSAQSVALIGGTIPGNSSVTISFDLIATLVAMKSTFTDVISATESGNGARSNFVSLTVTAPTIVVDPTPLPTLIMGVAMSQTITASGGTSPYTFAVTSGSLPPGLSLSSGGVISGTPTASGTFNFTVTATDSTPGEFGATFSGARAYTLIVTGAPTVASPTVTDLTGGTATLGGHVVDDGGLALSAAGVVLSPTDVNSDPKLGGTGVLTFSGTTTATPYDLAVPVTGLIPGTKYTYAAYATNAAGTGYSTVDTFVSDIGSSFVDTTQADFEAGTGTSIGTATSPGDVVLGLKGAVLDQQNDNNFAIVHVYPGLIAQTFTPSVSGALTQIDIFMSLSSGAITEPDLTVSLRATVDGVPSGPDLATATIAAAGFTNSSSAYHTATFANPVQVTAGTQYAFILSAVSDPQPGTYFIFSSIKDTYAGGALFSSNDGTTWAPSEALSGGPTDMGFKTYIDSSSTYATSGDLISSLKDSQLPSGTTHWSTLSWTATTPDGTSVKFQVAASDSPDGPFTFVGPDGTAATYFTDSGTDLLQFYGHRYLKYRAYLASTDSTLSPTLSDVTVAYDIISRAAIDSPTATDVTGNSATLGGTVTSTGSDDHIVYGVVYAPTAINSKPQLGGAGTVTVTFTPPAPPPPALPINGALSAALPPNNGVFTVPVTGLALNTSYTYTAYVTNVLGTSYTVTGTFTTLATGNFADTTQADFEAGTGTSIDTTTSPGDVVLGAAPAIDTIDQQVLDTTASTSLANPYSLAQIFTPAISGLLTRVELNISSNYVGTFPDITVTIRTTSNGVPTDTILATGTIPGFTNSTPTFYTATFSTPPVLTAGTQYAIVAETSVTPTIPYYLYGSLQGVDADVESYFYSPSSTAWVPNAVSFAFRTYVAASLASPPAYALTGDLISALKDSNLPAGTTHWTSLYWDADVPAGTSVQFQVAASDNPDGPFNFVGPDGTAATYFTDSGADLLQFYGHRYLKYRAVFATTDNTVTPTLYDVTVGYDAISVATIVCPTATGVTGNTATLGGTVTSTGGDDNAVFGVVYAPTSVTTKPQLGGDGVLNVEFNPRPVSVTAQPQFASTGGPSVALETRYGVFTVPVAGLVLNTSYTYSAYVTNVLGTAYTVTGTFTTTGTGGLTDTTQADFEAGTGTSTTASNDEVVLGLSGAVLDQQNTNTFSFVHVYPGLRAQTFTPSVSGALTQIDILMTLSSGATTEPDLTVSLRATVDGVPSGPDLATATIAAADFTNSSTAYHSATFANPVQVTAGTQYAFILSAVSDPQPGTYYIWSSGTDAYAGGALFSSKDGTNWDADQALGGGPTDMGFKTYIDSGSAYAASGDFTSVIKDSNLPAGKTHWTTLSWDADSPAGTSVQFQVAASDSPDGPFNFVGPDGTANTYFTDSPASLAQFYGHRYLQYRAYLATTDATVTPTLSGVTVAYDLVAPPAVSSTAATDLTGVSATLGGNVTFDGGGIISARGIVISATATNAAPTLDGTGTITLPATANGTGTYAVSASGLANGTSYSYVAYATNAGGTSYSDVATFTTIAPPVVYDKQLTASGTYGSVFGGYTIGANNQPSTYAADGLPTGLTVASDTGLISGTPTQTGVFNVAVSATNIAGTGSDTLVLTIAKATLTVTADPKAKVYGSANPAGTATIAGFVLNQTLGTSDVTGAPVVTVNADGTTAAGSAVITPSLGNLKSSHYDFQFVSGSLNITPYALTVTADPKSRAYGTANPAFTATISGFLNGQNLGTSGITGSPSVTSTALGTTPVGPAVITAAAGSLSSANYSFNFTLGTLTITKAVLTATADPKSRNYGAADPTFTATITGYANGETVAVVRGTPAFSNNATATSPIGNYVITPALGTLAADNYTFSYATGPLTIARATLTLAVNAATKVYGDDNPALTYRFVGFLNNETDTVVSGLPVLSTTAVKGSPAGNYPITVTAGTLASDNYSFNTTSVFSSNLLTVSKASLTAHVTDQARAYGTANATPVVTYTGFVLDENAAGALTGAPVATHTATSSSVVGSYPITLATGTLAATNYALTLVPGTLTVNPAALTVTADAKSKVYGAALPTLTATITGFANGDTAALVSGAPTLTTTATAGSDIGDYPITPALGTLTAANYTFGTFTNGTLSVTAADISIALDGLSQTYDGQPKSVTVTTTPAGLATTVFYNKSSSAPTAAGSYSVTARSTSANYTGSAQGALVIAQATQTVTFPAPAAVNVGLPLTLSATASSGLPVTFSVISGNATVTGTQLTVADSGPVVIRASQAGDDNYLPASHDATLATATLAAQTIAFDTPASHLTTDAPFALSATASSGLPVTFTYVSGPATLNSGIVTLNNTAGTIVVRASQAGNASYSPAPDVTQSITVTAKGPQVFFGGFGNGKTVASVSALAVAVGGGIAANLAPDGEDSTLIGYLPDSAGAFVLKFRLAADGTFSATTTSIPDPTASPAEHRGPVTRTTASSVLAATTLTFHGQVSGGFLTGSIDELSLPFSAEIQPETGTTAALAGFYQAAPLNSASGNIYSVVSADGTAFVLAITPVYVGGGTGTVDAGGAFTISTPQSGVVTGSVDPVSTSVTGTLTLPGQPAQPFAGLDTGTTRTDRLVNLSSRARITANSGDSTLITGFVIGGTVPKQVLLRGVGPALANYGVQNVAADPQLRIYDSTGHLIAQNDDWGGDPALAALFSTVGAGPLAAGSKDAALALTLAPGVYSMHVFTTGTAGVALAEIYDASITPTYERLLNISSRGPVSSGEGVLIAGFVITGNSPKRVLIRGAGPALTQSNVSGVLTDPILRLYDNAGTVIALNDNWETPVTVGNGQAAATATDLTAASTQVGAFPFVTGSKDSALIVVLAPGVYSVQVGSATNASGNALIEVYEIP